MTAPPDAKFGRADPALSRLYLRAAQTLTPDARSTPTRRRSTARALRSKRASPRSTIGKAAPT
jgi:hypothetical protein